MPKSFVQQSILSANGLNNGNAFTCVLDQTGPDNQMSVSVGGTQTGITLVAEGIVVGGSLWAPLQIQNKATGQLTSGSAVVPNNANQGYSIDCRGLGAVRFWPSAGTFTSFNIEAYSLKADIAPTNTLVSTAQSVGFVLLTGSADAIPPHTPQNYIVTTAGVDAMTLAAPTATADDGVVIRVQSDTAFAHTITSTGNLYTGGTQVNEATFAAHPGCSLELTAYQGKWLVRYSNGVTFS